MKKKLSFKRASRIQDQFTVCDATVDPNPNPKCKDWIHYKAARECKEKLMSALHDEPDATRNLVEKCKAAESTASGFQIPLRFGNADFFFIPGHQMFQAVLLARLYGKVIIVEQC